MSDGYCFKQDVFITSQLISSRIRNNNITLKTYFGEGKKNVLDSQEAYKHFNNVNDKHKHVFTNVTSDLNSFREVVKNDGMEPDVKKALLKTLRVKEEHTFIERLKTLNESGSIVIRGEQIADEQMPNWIDLIIDQLLKKHKFSKREMLKLIDEFTRFGFENIPTLYIKFSLFHISSIYAKKETPGDHIDFARLAVALPISDILFTDKKRKAELIELELPEKYKTKVFSGTEYDLQCLYNELVAL